MPRHPSVEVMRRYSVDYTARHDLSVCDDIMTEDYILYMGGHEVAGREDAYKPAAAKQFRQFPGLGFTVHDLVTNGDRMAMRFTEHGASDLHEGRAAAWQGVSLYTWNGMRLTSCAVEQDYFGRRRQLYGSADSVAAPMVAPWDVQPRAADPAAEVVVRSWLGACALGGGEVMLDDAVAGHAVGSILDADEVEVLDLFSAGYKVAFHARLAGTVVPGEEAFAPYAGLRECLYATGIVRVDSGRVEDGHLVRDRHGLLRRLRDERNPESVAA